MRALRAVWEWLDQRLGLAPGLQVIVNNLSKPLPPHVNWLFTLGAALVFLLGIQILTGALLMVYYIPSADQAHASIEMIVSEVPLGWLIRSLHNWGSHLIVIITLMHMARVFVYGGYKKPREVTWLIGVLLLGVILLFGFTGYLLPWDQVSYWGTVVATEAPASIPFVGSLIRQLLIGGEEVGGATLGRFFVAHVFLLPLALFGLMGIHLFLIRYQGVSSLGRIDEPEPTSKEMRAQGGKSFFPYHVLKDITTMYVIFGILLTLSLLYPPFIGDPADPLSTPPGIKPEWYFLPAYQLLKYVPDIIGVQIPLILFLLLILLPLVIDRSPERRARRRKRIVGGVVVISVIVVLLGILGHLSETTQTWFGKEYYFDLMGMPHPLIEIK